MAPVALWPGIPPSMLQLYQDLGPMLLDGFGQFTQAGDESVIIDAYLVSYQLAYEVNETDSQDYAPYTAPRPRFIEVLLPFGDIAILSGKIQPHGGHYHSVLQLQLPDAGRFK